MMNMSIIILLGIIILLLFVLVRRIDLMDRKSVKYVQVFRQERDFEMTKQRFKQLGYEISDCKRLPDNTIMIIFVKVK